MRRLALLVLVLAAAGCGGGTRVEVVQPTLPRALASTWEAQANAVAVTLARGDGCSARSQAASLRSSIIHAVQARQVRPVFQETLLAAANDLVGRIHCSPPAPQPTAGRPPHEHGHGHGHGHGKGHGKHGRQ